MLALLYNTGDRVSERIGVRVAGVTLAATSSVRLHGKGRKQRTVPLWKETATEIRRWLQYADLCADQSIVPNRSERTMKRTNVADRLTLAITAVTTRCPQLARRPNSPHSIRHTTAMHMLQSGVDVKVIALWLGDESPVTTHGYVEADLAMKERALSTIAPPETKRKRYRPSDAVLKFLERL